MGSWGEYYQGSGKNGRPTLKEVKIFLQEAHLGRVVVKLGYAYAIIDKEVIANNPDVSPDLENYISIVKWWYADGMIWTKDISECSGPAFYDVPLKYVNKLCRRTMNNDYSIDWRNRIIQNYRAKVEARKTIRAMKTGDLIEIFGKFYHYQHRSVINRNKHFVSANNSTFGITENRLIKDLTR